MTSIRRTLLWTLLPAVLLLLAIAVLAGLHELRDEIDELFDVQLMQAARTASAQPSGDRQLARTTPAQPSGDGELADPDDDPSQELVVAVWNGGSSAPVFHSRTRVPLARLRAPGFSTIEINGEDWRIYTNTVGQQTVQAAQPVRIRTEASAEIASRIALPMLLLVPVIVVTVLLLLKRGLRPLTRFTQELDSRSHNALESVPLKGLPAELLPMATAMNHLLSRLQAALSAQQIFVADATHELLTPLTALQVQVQRLERAKSADRVAQARSDVRRSLERCINLARQLLMLARHSAERTIDAQQPLQLGDTVRAAMGDVLPKAHERRIDLGITNETACVVTGDEKAIQTLLGNLLENAVKYSPVAGRVDVSILTRGNTHVVIVSDTGPGIASSEQVRVFDRFYRASGLDAEGSGLGLAIAREIAERHGATIELRSPGQLGGLDVEVSFTFANRTRPCSR